MTDLKIWKYFLSLERDFIKTLQYVELDEGNFGCFSIEYSKLLLLIGTEFEAVSKKLLKGVSYKDKVGNIGGIKEGLLKSFPNFKENQVCITGTEYSFVPFKEWKPEKSIEWWKCYCELKHNRISAFDKANMKNVLEGLASLLIVNIYYYHHIKNYDELILENNFLETNGVIVPIFNTVGELPDTKQNRV
jgi:hypothetical protein